MHLRCNVANTKLFALLAVITINQFKMFESVTFGKKTGVSFSPFVKRPEKNNVTGVLEIPPWESYTLDNLKTMLSIVTTKFSRIITVGGVARADPFVTSNRNFNRCERSIELVVAQASALLNKANGSRVLSVYHDFSVHSLPSTPELQESLKCFQMANSIFQGTVQGILFSTDTFPQSLTFAVEVLTLIRSVKAEAKKINLRIGSRQKCADVNIDPQFDADPQLTLTRQQTLNESDFTICEIFPGTHYLRSGPEKAFISVREELLLYQRQFKDFNPVIEVMGQTRWPSEGENSWENIDNLRGFWQVVDNFTRESNMSMWLFEAFDEPWRNGISRKGNASHHGWWRLKRNEDIDKLTGYIEKINAPPESKQISDDEDDKSMVNPWAYIGLAIGLIMAGIVVFAMYRLFKRVNTLQNRVKAEDIKEFMNGMSGDSMPQEIQGLAESSAFAFPYDRKYEIEKNKLSIKRKKLLGAGQFGAVFRATLEIEGSDAEVALKMAKAGCPANAMKSLLSEIKILIYLGKHPNIVSIVGAYTAEIGTGVVYVATELCMLGSLESYLRKSHSNNLQNLLIDETRYANYSSIKLANESRLAQEVDVEEPSIEFRDMITWSHEIACGMQYLGTKNVVHADLATRNILLTFDKTAKITDFGLSRKLYDYTNYVKKQQEPLPWRWLAIESLRRMEFSAKSDAWSYGITLWEIFAMGDLPYPGLSWNLGFVDSLIKGLRMKCPPHATQEVFALMENCWQAEPKSRPTFTELKVRTGQILSTSMAN